MNWKLLILSGVSFLTGCSIFSPGGSSDFACPGMPKGIVCKTPRQVYDISTNEQKSGKSGYNPGPVEVVMVGRDHIGNLEPVPVLEQARVMRIWIAPWTDKNKDQHWPGLIFTVMQAHQWRVGDDNFEGVEPPVPHRISSVLPMPAAKPVDGDGSARSQPKAQNEILN
jgi:conjugal transfer pilus assembly protein TraV